MVFCVEILIWYVLLLFAARYMGRDGLITYVVSAAVIANVETTQFIRVMGMDMPGGIIPFACLFLATDVSSEMFGKEFSHRLVVYSGAGMLLSSLVVTLFGMNEGVSDSFRTAFSATLRIAFASISVYYICGRLDVRLYHAIGKIAKYKWLRNNVATITAQFVNAFLFILLAFGWMGVGPVVGNWLISLCLALLDTPMLYIITGKDRFLKE